MWLRCLGLAGEKYFWMKIKPYLAVFQLMMNTKTVFSWLNLFEMTTLQTGPN